MWTNGYNGTGMTSTKPLISLVLDHALLERLDEYRWAHRLASRGAAIRYLLEAALDLNPTPEPLLHEPADPSSIDYVPPGRKPQTPIVPTVAENTARVASRRRRQP